MQEIITDAQTGTVTIRNMTADEIAALQPDKPTWRASAKTTRAAFCIAIARAGIVTAQDAIAAAKGDWPTAFDAALAGLPTQAQTEARITWAAVTEIDRTHPLIGVVQAFLRLTDDQTDALFA